MGHPPHHGQRVAAARFGVGARVWLTVFGAAFGLSSTTKLPADVLNCTCGWTLCANVLRLVPDRAAAAITLPSSARRRRFGKDMRVSVCNEGSVRGKTRRVSVA